MTAPKAPCAPAPVSRPELDIIFSLADGFVWASWPGTSASVRLGRHDVVALMMEDFLAQDALSERLRTLSSN